MSGAVTATTVLAAAAVAGTAYSIYAGEKASKKQTAAQNEARAAAQKQEKLADEAVNAANRKTPDTGALLTAAGNMGATGPMSTMLTGPAGVDSNTLSLGKNTLLGG